MRERVIELYAGPGGMSEALHLAGVNTDNALGVEYDAAACETARAAGHRRLHADILGLDPSAWDMTGVTGLHFSPPCQGFSAAGHGKGRADTDRILGVLADATLSRLPDLARFASEAADHRSVHMLEPLRWIAASRPEWITAEQVPAVLPLWEAYAVILRAAGYSVATGIVHAETLGVPQTRKRAIMIASRVRPVALPSPTHSRYYSRTPDRLDEGVARWVSMAEALGWGMMARPYLTVAPGGRWLCPAGVSGAGAPRFDDLATCTGPRQIREHIATEVEARLNNQSGTDFNLAWPADRPAPVIAGRGLVTMPGANANRFNGATKSRNDGIRITVQEAAILQSFRPDYPWRGGSMKQYEQVGNAVPPLMGLRMAQAAIGIGNDNNGSE